MNIKKTAKKIVAVSAGMGLASATLMSALAVAPDLADYPSDFIVDGQFDGKIVVGDQAASEDIIGAIDIASSLQAASTSEVAVGDSTTTVSVEGDAAQIADSGDILELGEDIFDVTNTLTSDDLGMLADGRVTNEEGSTDYTQVLKLIDNNGVVEWTESEIGEELGYYLSFSESDVFTYELDFTSGLESDIENDGSLEDFEDELITFMGQQYSIVNADLDSGVLTMELIAGDISDTLEEGQTRTYSVDDSDYEVTILVVGSDSVKFLVNGEATDSLEEGETDTLPNGLEIGVREIIQSDRNFEGDQGSIVEFYLGANTLTLQGADGASGDVELGDEDIEEAVVMFDFSNTSTSLDLRSISYTLDIDFGDEEKVAAGEGLRSILDEPEGMINPSFDVVFEGVSEPNRNMIEFDAQGDDEYDLVFTNERGTEFDVPFINVNGANVDYGEQNGDNFVFWEVGGNASDLPATFLIQEDDYFVISDNGGNELDEDADSYVYEFNDVDEDDTTVSFSEASSGNEIEEQYSTLYMPGDTITTPSGTITVSGTDFDFFVWSDNATSPTYRLAIDQNGDDLLAGLAYTDTSGLAYNVTEITVRGGGILSLSEDSQVETASPEANVTLTTVDDDIDSDSGDQVNTFTFDISGSEFGAVSFADSSLMQQDDSNDDREVGVNRYGTWFETVGGNNEADDLMISYPVEQVEALVYVVGGEVSRSTSVSGGASASQVNILSVGLAVLDTEVDYDEDNMIVVGGPCVNSIAAQLLDNPSDCTEGFTQGMGMIQSFDTGDNFAILVAGFEARDTVESSRVLARAATEMVDGLEGTSVEVVVAGSNDVSLRAMSEDMDMEAEE